MAINFPLLKLTLWAQLLSCCVLHVDGFLHPYRKGSGVTVAQRSRDLPFVTRENGTESFLQRSNSLHRRREGGSSDGNAGVSTTATDVEMGPMQDGPEAGGQAQGGGAAPSHPSAVVRRAEVLNDLSTRLLLAEVASRYVPTILQFPVRSLTAWLAGATPSSPVPPRPVNLIVHHPDSERQQADTDPAPGAATEVQVDSKAALSQPARQGSTSIASGSRDPLQPELESAGFASSNPNALSSAAVAPADGFPASVNPTPRGRPIIMPASEQARPNSNSHGAGSSSAGAASSNSNQPLSLARPAEIESTNTQEELPEDSEAQQLPEDYEATYQRILNAMRTYYEEFCNFVSHEKGSLVGDYDREDEKSNLQSFSESLISSRQNPSLDFFEFWPKGFQDGILDSTKIPLFCCSEVAKDEKAAITFLLRFVYLIILKPLWDLILKPLLIWLSFFSYELVHDGRKGLNEGADPVVLLGVTDREADFGELRVEWEGIVRKFVDEWVGKIGKMEDVAKQPDTLVTSVKRETAKREDRRLSDSLPNERVSGDDGHGEAVKLPVDAEVGQETAAAPSYERLAEETDAKQEETNAKAGGGQSSKKGEGRS